MSRYACPVCGYIHDEAEGDPATGIAPGTGWKGIPPDWKCPVCGAPKSLFEPARGAAPVASQSVANEADHVGKKPQPIPPAQPQGPH